MDIRILTLLVLISVVGSFAEFQAPFVRTRRNGIEEVTKPHIADFVQAWRTKRAISGSNGESENSNKTESITSPTTTQTSSTPKSTSDPIDPSSSTDPVTISTTETDPTTVESDSDTSTTAKEDPATSSTTKSNPPTTTTAKVDPTTKSTSKPNPTTITAPKSSPTTKSTSKSEPTTSATPKPNPSTRSAFTSDSTTSSTTSKSNPTPSSTDDTPASTSTPSIMTTTESTPKPKKPTDSGTEPNPEKPPASSGLASRSNFEPSESEPKDSDKKPELKSGEDKNSIPSYGFPTPFYPGFPSFAPAFAPNYIPDYSSYNPYRGDPAFNSIPGAGNYAWTGTSNAGGNAAASASASASSGSYADPGFYGSAPSFSSRGGFVDNTPTYPAYGNTGVDPSVYGPNTFAFPAFDPDPFNIQKQMDEHFRQLQAQFEQHQRAIFDQNNRLSNDGLGNNPGLQGAYSSINVGPRGGFQTGAINPPVVGIESRFAEDVPAPSGNSFGVFSSSSSSSRTGPDGKQITHKSATTGVNDNGKITYRTVHN